MSFAAWLAAAQAGALDEPLSDLQQLNRQLSELSALVAEREPFLDEELDDAAAPVPAPVAAPVPVPGKCDLGPAGANFINDLTGGDVYRGAVAATVGPPGGGEPFNCDTCEGWACCCQKGCGVVGTTPGETIKVPAADYGDETNPGAMVSIPKNWIDSLKLQDNGYGSEVALNAHAFGECSKVMAPLVWKSPDTVENNKATIDVTKPCCLYTGPMGGAWAFEACNALEESSDVTKVTDCLGAGCSGCPQIAVCPHKSWGGPKVSPYEQTLPAGTEFTFPTMFWETSSYMWADLIGHHPQCTLTVNGAAGAPSVKSRGIALMLPYETLADATASIDAQWDTLKQKTAQKQNPATSEADKARLVKEIEEITKVRVGAMATTALEMEEYLAENRAALDAAANDPVLKEIHGNAISEVEGKGAVAQLKISFRVEFNAIQHHLHIGDNSWGASPEGGKIVIISNKPCTALRDFLAPPPEEAAFDGKAPLCVLLRNMQRFYSRARTGVGRDVRPLFYCNTHPDDALTTDQLNGLIAQATPVFVGRERFDGCTWSCTPADQDLPSCGGGGLALGGAAIGGLPEGWVEKVDPSTNRKFYVDDIHKTTSWTRPVPEDWDKAYDDEGRRTGVDRPEDDYEVLDPAAQIAFK